MLAERFFDTLVEVARTLKVSFVGAFGVKLSHLAVSLSRFCIVGLCGRGKVWKNLKLLIEKLRESYFVPITIIQVRDRHRHSVTFNDASQQQKLNQQRLRWRAPMG